MNGEVNNHIDVGVLDNRVSTLERGFEKIASAIESIDQSLQVLTRLDIKHDETAKAVERAFQEIRNHQAVHERLEERMRFSESVCIKSDVFESYRRSVRERDDKIEVRINLIEEEMPTIKLIRRGIIYMVAMIFGILVVAVLNTILLGHSTDQTKTDETHKQKVSPE